MASRAARLTWAKGISIGSESICRSIHINCGAHLSRNSGPPPRTENTQSGIIDCRSNSCHNKWLDREHASHIVGDGAEYQGGGRNLGNFCFSARARYNEGSSVSREVVRSYLVENLLAVDSPLRLVVAINEDHQVVGLAASSLTYSFVEITLDTAPMLAERVLCPFVEQESGCWNCAHVMGRSVCDGERLLTDRLAGQGKQCKRHCLLRASRCTSGSRPAQLQAVRAKPEQDRGGEGDWP